MDALAHESHIQNESLKRIHNEQIHHKRQLELEKNRKSEILATLSKEVTRQQKKIDELKQDEQRLSNLIEKLNRQLARKKALRPKQMENRYYATTNYLTALNTGVPLRH